MGVSPQQTFLQHKLQTLRSVGDYFWKGTQPRWPTEVYLEISNVCNLRCAMCEVFSDVSEHRAEHVKTVPRGFFEFDRFRENLAPVLEHALCVHCFGFGEPTLYPAFHELVAFVSKYEVLTNFVTNGTRLDQSLAEFLVDRRVYGVTVSFSGSTAQDYEAIYRGADYDAVLENITTLARRRHDAGSRWPKIRIQSLAFEHHVASFDRFVRIMGKAGANSVSLNPVIVSRDTLHLAHHAAIYQPSRHNAVLRRARLAAIRHGVWLHTRDWLRVKVASSSEIERIRAEHVSPAPVAPELLSNACRIPLPQMNDFARSLAAENGGAPERVEACEPAVGNGSSMIRQDNPASLVLQKLRLTKDPIAFRCPQPFSTLYVDVYGRLRPCCQSHATPAMGFAGEENAAAVFQGTGLQLVRAAVATGRYPLLCQTCLSTGNAPHVPIQLFHAWMYGRWSRAVFGSRIPLGLTYGLLLKYALQRWVFARMPKVHPDLDAVLKTASPTTPSESLATLQKLLAQANDEPAYRDMILQGHIDGISDGHLTGWAWSPVFPDLPLPVSLRRGDHLLASGVANVYREDLQQAGKGSGRCSFALPTTGLPPLEDLTQVRLCLGDTPVGITG